MMSDPFASPYRLVEYLESDGTQYIQTDYTPVANDNIDVKLYLTSNASECPFSAGTGTYQTIAVIANGILYIRYFAVNGANLGSFATGVCRRIVVSKTGMCSVYSAEGSIIAQAQSQYISQLDGNDTTLRLFGRRTTGTSYYGRIYDFTILNDGETKIHLVPCIRKSDNKPGMYDTVTKTFYTNAGTGEFIVPA